MPSVRGCNLPDDLLYDVDNHIWFTEVGDGTVKIAGKSCGTLESGKWVGPAKSLAGGEVVAVNDALVEEPSIANDDPYEKGWLLILKPDDWDSVKGSLVPGSDVTAAYEAKMDSEGFGGCE